MRTPGEPRPQRRQPSQVRAGERLLHPEHAVIRQPGRDVPRRLEIDRRRGVAGHPPALVQVDHDRHRVADGGTRRCDRGEPFLEPARVDADLEGSEPLLAQPQGGFGPFWCGHQHPAGGVRRQRVGRAAEQRGDRQPRDLARDVPQGRLERPVPTCVEVDRLEDSDVPSDRERILTDEEVLEGFETVHRVARADADDALVGLDADDRHRERGSRHGVPRRREGRIEGHAEALETDGADPHGASIADVSRSSLHPSRDPGRIRRQAVP